jgi:branched-chain amino acid transport system ATP-binding protein
MLCVSDLSVSYGGVPALRGADLVLREAEYLAIVGPNGAGKTTLLRAISGTAPVNGGSVSLDGVELVELEGFQRAQLGVVHVPEGRHIFRSMSVRENLMLGAYRATARPRFDERLDLVRELFPALMPRLDEDAGGLSGGQQQMLAVARGLMACPRVLLLDEPSMGLSPVATDQVFEGIARLRELDAMAVMIVEQRTHEVLDICQRAYVLESGSIQLEGTPQELLADRRLTRAYLGGEL